MKLTAHPKKGQKLSNGYTVHGFRKKRFPGNCVVITILLMNDKGKKRQAIYFPEDFEIGSFSKNMNGHNHYYLGW